MAGYEGVLVPGHEGLLVPGHEGLLVPGYETDPTDHTVYLSSFVYETVAHLYTSFEV